jgi:hypothetical protein
MFESIAETASSQMTARLTAVVDGLLGVDADSLADTELVETVVELHRQ